MIGAETANHLANHGKVVTLIEMLPEIATEVPNINRMTLLSDLEKANIKVLVNTTVKDILPDGVVVVKDCATETISADTVIVAAGAKPNNDLQAELAGKPYKVITAGDANKIGKVMEAIESGYLAGAQI
jgi:pyruvate/2-oxoglutarate dehydrogenase complex dihydrolipoamide dehydrogenase (E3) component